MSIETRRTLGAVALALGIAVLCLLLILIALDAALAHFLAGRPDELRMELESEPGAYSVMALSCGAENLYDGWMKDPRPAMISCNDGIRPVSFLLEAPDGNVDVAAPSTAPPD